MPKSNLYEYFYEYLYKWLYTLLILFNRFLLDEVEILTVTTLTKWDQENLSIKFR